MSRRWHHFNAHRRSHGSSGLRVELTNQPVPFWSLRSGDQRRRGTGARTEQRQGQLARIALLAQPISSSGQPFREPADVKAQFSGTQVDLLLLRRQQVQQQGCPAALLKDARHTPIPWTVATAATSVREEHNAAPSCTINPYTTLYV